MIMQKNNPSGLMVLKTVAMPCDSNCHGNAFGGWIMSQVDIAGGIFTRYMTSERFVTVNVTNFNFYHAIHIGDVVCCYVDHIKTGKSSITLSIKVYTEKTQAKNQPYYKCVCSASFTYVTIDNNLSKALADDTQNLDLVVDSDFLSKI